MQFNLFTRYNRSLNNCRFSKEPLQHLVGFTSVHPTRLRMDFNFGTFKQVRVSMHHIDATNLRSLLPCPIQSRILIALYPDVDVATLAKTSKMLRINLSNTLPFQHTASKPIGRESLLQIDTLPIHYLIPLLYLCCHAHPCEIEHFIRRLLLHNKLLNTSETDSHKRLLLGYFVQFAPL